MLYIREKGKGGFAMMKSCFGGLNILIMLYPVLCLEDTSLCRIGTPQKCSNVTGSFRSSEYSVISSGSCEFDFDFCSYKQRCTGSGSLPWENVNGSAVMQGQTDLADSYSVLGSPVIYIPCNSNLIINVTIANPSQLEIALIKNNASCILRQQTYVVTEENFNEILLIEGPAYIEILFRGYNGGGSSVVQSYVRLHSVQLTTARNCTDPTGYPTLSTQRIECSTADVPTDHSTTSESYTVNIVTKYLTQEKETKNLNVGAIAGPIMAGLAIVTIILVVWTWKSRREICHGTKWNERDLKNTFQQQTSSPTSVEDLRTDEIQVRYMNIDEVVTSNISVERNSQLYSPLEVGQPDTHTYGIIQGEYCGGNPHLQITSDHDPCQLPATTDYLTCIP